MTFKFLKISLNSSKLSPKVYENFRTVLIGLNFLKIILFGKKNRIKNNGNFMQLCDTLILISKGKKKLISNNNLL